MTIFFELVSIRKGANISLSPKEPMMESIDLFDCSQAASKTVRDFAQNQAHPA